MANIIAVDTPTLVVGESHQRKLGEASLVVALSPADESAATKAPSPPGGLEVLVSDRRLCEVVAATSVASFMKG